MGIPGIRIKRCEQKIEFVPLHVYEYVLNCRESEKKECPLLSINGFVISNQENKSQKYLPHW